jgi:uncharacterized OB-fold protein
VNVSDETPTEKARTRRQENLAKGMCAVCGKNPVTKKKTCDDCIAKQVRSQERSVFKKYGIPLPKELE